MNARGFESILIATFKKFQFQLYNTYTYLIIVFFLFAVYNRFEVNFRLKQLGLGRVKNVEPLSEKDAIELGGDMLGELLVFTFGAIILVSEYSRSARKEHAKEQKVKDDMQKIQDRLTDLKTVTTIQESQIKDLQKYIDSVVIKLEKKPEPASSSQQNTPKFKIFGS